MVNGNENCFPNYYVKLILRFETQFMKQHFLLIEAVEAQSIMKVKSIGPNYRSFSFRGGIFIYTTTSRR